MAAHIVRSAALPDGPAATGLWGLVRLCTPTLQPADEHPPRTRHQVPSLPLRLGDKCRGWRFPVSPSLAGNDSHHRPARFAGVPLRVFSLSGRCL